MNFVRKTTFLIWTSALTIVLLMVLEINPPYGGVDIPRELENFVSVNVKSVDFEALKNISR